MTIPNFGTQQPTTPSRVITRLRQMLQSGTQAMITGGTIGVICKAVKDAMQELQATGMVSSSRMASRDEVTALLGLAHVYELEHTYGAGAAQPVG